MNALSSIPESAQEIAACFGKVAYDGARQARRALARMTRRPNWRAIGPSHKLQPYRCRSCHAWHLGNSER